MSYSFAVSGATKVLALAAVASALDKVVADQPVHANDRAQAEAAVEALVAIAREPGEGEELRVNVAGSLGWSKVEPAHGEFTNASLNINVGVFAKT